MAVDLHISVTVAVQGGEHDAERPGPVTEQHEQTVSQWLLREDGPSLMHWKQKQYTLEKTDYNRKLNSHYGLFNRYETMKPASKMIHSSGLWIWFSQLFWGYE